MQKSLSSLRSHNKYLYETSLVVLINIFILFGSTLMIAIPLVVGEYQTLPQVGFNLWMLSLGLGFWAAFIISFIIGKRYDVKFKDKIINDPFINSEIPSIVIPGRIYAKIPLIRAVHYCIALLFPSRTKKWVYKKWFDGYDFKQDAHLSDYICCYALLLVFLIHLAGMALMAVGNISA